MFQMEKNKLLITETRASQAEGPCQAREREGSSIALPHGKEGQSIPRARQRWTHSCGTAKNSCSSMYECEILICAVTL
jgi:hypothetical protein